MRKSFKKHITKFRLVQKSLLFCSKFSKFCKILIGVCQYNDYFSFDLFVFSKRIESKVKYRPDILSIGHDMICFKRIFVEEDKLYFYITKITHFFGYKFCYIY